MKVKLKLWLKMFNEESLLADCVVDIPKDSDCKMANDLAWEQSEMISEHISTTWEVVDGLPEGRNGLG